MIESPILYYVSWYQLEILQNKTLNYIYADALAREQVLQQKVDPNSYYTISQNYKIWFLPCSQFDTLESVIRERENLVVPYCSNSVVCNDDLCKITGINYYGLVEQYQKNICIIDLDEFYK